MSETVKPATLARSAAVSPDDLDGLLRAYFQTEMPHPWPALPLPEVAPSRRPFSLIRSRWALAASVLALLLGHAVLTRTFPDVAPAGPDQGPGHTIGLRPGAGKLSDNHRSEKIKGPPSAPR